MYINRNYMHSFAKKKRKKKKKKKKDCFSVFSCPFCFAFCVLVTTDYRYACTYSLAVDSNIQWFKSQLSIFLLKVSVKLKPNLRKMDYRDQLFILFFQKRFRVHCKMVFKWLRFQKLSNKMIAHWSKKLNHYWYDENKQRHIFTRSPPAVNNLNTACYVIQSKQYKEK